MPVLQFDGRLESDQGACFIRVPPETLASVVRLVDASYPTRAPLVYLKEMESIYLTTEGQKLSMRDCFLQAFGRANGR